MYEIWLSEPFVQSDGEKVKILYGRCFGIGNAVMAIPAIKALQTLGEVDILVGNSSDDVGASEILSYVVQPGCKLYVNHAFERHYDVAVMAIPFDGRWHNGINYTADRVMDWRTRPDPSTTGLVSWKKHESEYQMDNARELGFVGETPNCTFRKKSEQLFSFNVFLGVGYKKDSAGFWKRKHWGNENFSEFINILVRTYREKYNIDINVYMSGDYADYIMSMVPIFKGVDPDLRGNVHTIVAKNLEESIEILDKCGVYVGNDTGMMHVAAAMGKDIVALFFLENSVTKSSPLRVGVNYIHVIDAVATPASATPLGVFEFLSTGVWY